ncbi:MAG: MBL fold metallo-hydrolase [Promethearchaeota archaeon]|nr:MAG: MBL fold metallo-hydrolase [Candidatus Lokiarchaeota archaeon]
MTSDMFKIEIFLLTNNVIFPFQNLERDFNLDFIKLNKLFATKSLAEHGLGFLINIYEREELSSDFHLIKKIVFDTGGPNQTFLHNLDARGYPIYDTDIIVLSHWHYDHSGGLYKILERIENPVPILCHKSATYERFFIRSADINPITLVNKKRSEIVELLNSAKIVNQLPINIKRIEETGEKIIMHKTLETIFARDQVKIMVSGEIPKTHNEEIFSNFLINKEGVLRFDEILDDKCLIIEIGKSTILLNGCCHSGIMNTLDYVKEKSSKPISHIIGGFHMANSTQERIDVTLDFLSNFQKEKVILFPIHCSGEKFIANITTKNFPNVKAFNASVGTIFNFFS